MIPLNKIQSAYLARLSERLRAARLARNEEQSLFGQRLGLTARSYRRLERGDPRVPLGDWIQALDALGRLDELNQLLAHQSLFDAIPTAVPRQRARRRRS